jgi:hypothetical protein
VRGKGHDPPVHHRLRSWRTYLPFSAPRSWPRRKPRTSSWGTFRAHERCMKCLSMKDSPGYRTSFPMRQECSGIHHLLRHSPSLAVSGPIFHFSDTWRLVINTSTTIVTFLMVFLIQNTQNRDGAEIQAKLDELIRASTASNRFIGIESLTQEERWMSFVRNARPQPRPKAER